MSRRTVPLASGGEQAALLAPDVSVIIVNWNGSRLLGRCLSALRIQTHPSYQVVLVDNGSSDDSLTLIERDYPEVAVIRNDTNLGFAAANNIALNRIQSRYVATLNNDTQVEPTWLAELARGMEKDPAIGMCASKMLFLEDQKTINSAGISVDRAGIAWDRRGGEPDDDRSEQPEEIFGPCAGAALYRRKMLEEISFFDEDFFAYMEDVDLAWRAQLAGWRCLYVPTALVYHAHSATAGEGSPFKNRLKGRNTLWTIAKNYPWPHWLCYLPAILFYDLAAVAYTLVVRRDVNPLRGRLEALRELRSLMLKRRAVQALRVVPSRVMLSRLEPIESPLRVLRRYRHLRKMGLGRE